MTTAAGTMAVVAVVASADGAVPVAATRTDRADSTTVVWLPAEPEPDLSFAGEAWLVEQRPQWDGCSEPVPPGWPVPGFKQLTFIRRAAGITRGEFAHHWSTVHAPLARVHHPALWRYQQNVVVRPLLPGMTDDVDGIAELTMRLRLDFTERMYDSPAGRDVVGHDVRQFIDLRGSRQILTREYRS